MEDKTNHKNGVLVKGTSSADYIENYGSNVTISAGKDDDTISNRGWFTSINGGAGNDSIDSWHSNKVTIAGGAGNDLINSYGDDVTLTGGAGSDSIFLGNSKNHLIKYKVGDGNDYIHEFNSTSTLSISGGSYSTQVSGYDVLVKVGSGSIRLKNVYATADTLHINNKKIKLKRKAIKLTADNNQLEVARDSISIVGSSSDDLIKNYGANVTLSGGKGNDSIENNNANALISGGAGSDSITSWWGDYVTINAGAGNDLINSYGEGATINGGNGDDTVFLGSSTNHLIQYKSGDGSDIVYGFKTTSTLQIGGSYSTQASGNDVLVNVGKETVTLKNVYASADKLHINNKTIKLKRKAVKLTAADNWIEVSRDSISVVGSSSDDNISNYANKVTISAGKGNDHIDNEEGSNVLINGGAGDDEISNWGGSNVTIDGGAGDDRIDIYNGENESANISINGGAGDDEISNWGGTNVTLNGGAGDDYLVGGEGKDIFVYKPGDGNDIIFDYSSGDMLKILKSNGKSGGSFTKSKFSDGTLSLTISGGGQVIFNDVAQGDKFNINGKTYTLGASKLK